MHKKLYFLCIFIKTQDGHKNEKAKETEKIKKTENEYIMIIKFKFITKCCNVYV